MSTYDFSKFIPEDGIEVPNPHWAESNSQKVRDLLASMKPGQSVLLPKGLRDVYATVATETPQQFTYRTVDADHIRVWRVKGVSKPVEPTKKRDVDSETSNETVDDITPSRAKLIRENIRKLV